MECNYDEDLNQNAFFQLLQSEHHDLFQKATLEGWVVCVPRVGALPKYPLSDEDFLSHILIPSDELPESHFCSLTDRQVKVLDRAISVEAEDGQTFSTQILFEETCYTEDLYKYKVLCLESVLQPHTCVGHSSSQPLIALTSLRDCIDFLWAESSGQQVLEGLDESIQGFLAGQPDLEEEPIQNQVDLAKGLYEHCLRSTLKDEKLQAQVRSNRHLKQNVRIAVETYVQHGIYKSLIKGITAVTAVEDAKLNKIIRNSTELQLKDLDVRNELYEKIPSAKQELAKIDGYSTVLGKVGCIQKALMTLSGPTMAQVISADDFLPILIFLVVKVSLPNWLAHLTMMKDFNFSDDDENLNSFLVTSLEAAVEHIRSGRLFEPLCPEALLGESADLEAQKMEKGSLEFLFHNIRADNLVKVQELLTPSNLLDDLSADSLCHPLCACEKCESELNRQKTDLSLSLNTANEKGQTALHTACKHGRLQMAEFLLEIGAQVTSKDLHGNTALHYAALGGHQQLMLLLLNSRAGPGCVDNNGNTSLHFAAQNGHETCVKALVYFCEHLGRPLNVNVVNSSGDTPLHHAARWGFEGIVQILLEAGARPNARNNRKVTPMDQAHSVRVSRMLNTVTRPSRGGFQKRLSFIKMTIAAASKLRLDLLDASSSAGSPLSSPSRSRESLLEYGSKPLTMQQSKKVIFGPMFSGKTTELIRRMKRYQVANKSCLVFKYSGDTRYDNVSLSTHDQQKLPAISASILQKYMDIALKYEVIGIDEGQFFSDTVEFCEKLADSGKVVVVAALDGTYQRQGFGNILNLVPLAESVEKLNAVCMMCFGSASYTKRIGDEQEVEVIGGTDKYMAVCRGCYHKKPSKGHRQGLKPFNDLTNTAGEVMEMA